MAMDRFFVATNRDKDPDYRVTDQIKALLEQGGKTCMLGPRNAHQRISDCVLPEELDCVIVVGGDGSLIEVARMLYPRSIPILGINMGTVGYLTEVEVGDLEGAIHRIVQQQYTLENRMMLEAVFPDGRKNIAFNDVVLSRKEAIRPLRFRLYVNEELLNSYESDGIILSTPTGSTAYNLSAGGPIVKPTAELIVLTPICSHALNASSVILADSDEVTIEIAEGKGGDKEEAIVAFDGTDPVTLVSGDQFQIRKAKETTSIVKLTDMSFLELLRRKMKGN